MADGGDLIVVPIGGFAQRQRIEDAAWTFGQVLKADIGIAAILDRDYICDEEIENILVEMRENVPRFYILGSKEIENYLLVPRAIEKAIVARLRGQPEKIDAFTSAAENAALNLLLHVTESMKSHVHSQLLANKIRYLDKARKDISTISKHLIADFEVKWQNPFDRLKIVPGKETLSALNKAIEKELNVSITSTQIISHLQLSDIPKEFVLILKDIDEFAKH